MFRYTKNKNRAYVVFIDLSKAFDRVDHFLLGQKLLDEEIPPDLVLIILQYLRNQSARVCWNGVKGNFVSIDQGVRQGGIISPFLFKFYINKLLDDISKDDIGCRFGFLKLNVYSLC